MPVGIFLTHIAAPALGCSVEKNGDVHDKFILNQEHVFTKDNRNKFLGEVVVEDGAVLHHVLSLGRTNECQIGNGNLKLPSKYQLMLGVDDINKNDDVAVPVCKKRRLEF
jgi:hypothetical protein